MREQEKESMECSSTKDLKQKLMFTQSTKMLFEFTYLRKQKYAYLETGSECISLLNLKNQNLAKIVQLIMSSNMQILLWS